MANPDIVTKRIVTEGFIKLAYTNNFVNVKVNILLICFLNFLLQIFCSYFLCQLLPYFSFELTLQILGSLLFALFNPATIEEDPNLFQCLSLFFPSYSFHSIEHQELIVHAFSEATCLIFGASKDSILGLIDLQKFVESMLYLTDPENCTKKTEGYKIFNMFINFCQIQCIIYLERLKLNQRLTIYWESLFALK